MKIQPEDYPISKSQSGLVSPRRTQKIELQILFPTDRRLKQILEKRIIL